MGWAPSWQWWSQGVGGLWFHVLVNKVACHTMGPKMTLDRIPGANSYTHAK